MYSDPDDKVLNWHKLEGEFLGNFHRPIQWRSYQTVIEKASKSMIRFKKPEHLIKMIVRTIDKEVGTAHSGILLYDQNRNSYVLIDSKEEKEKMVHTGAVTFPVDSPLIRVFSEPELAPLLDESGALMYHSINKILNDEDFLAKNPLFIEPLKTIKSQMELLKVEVCIPSFFKKKLAGVLMLGRKLEMEEFERWEISFFSTLASNAALAISNIQLVKRLQENIKEINALYEKSHTLFIRISVALAVAIEARDSYTHGHIERVTGYSLVIGEELGDVPERTHFENFREALHIAALLHDIGKVVIPDSILNKNGTLTAEEFERVKEHPAIGATILYPIRELRDIIGGVRSHQERFDGNGYPDRLRGKDIPLLARIIAVADTFDAMTTKRPYRDKKPMQEAIAEIKECAGTQFDPDIVDAFLTASRKNKFF